MSISASPALSGRAERVTARWLRPPQVSFDADESSSAQRDEDIVRGQSETCVEQLCEQCQTIPSILGTTLRVRAARRLRLLTARPAKTGEAYLTTDHRRLSGWRITSDVGVETEECTVQACRSRSLLNCIAPPQRLGHHDSTAAGAAPSEMGGPSRPINTLRTTLNVQRDEDERHDQRPWAPLPLRRVLRVGGSPQSDGTRLTRHMLCTAVSSTAQVAASLLSG
ncbi:hypothetical protein PHYPSEUDO_011276 [Phytophthora pseudosyringae]|uniref:Uncharacterized protein n=1 Tax=Phytophthora pseudosyringae TaxID=221518 RepID=A0A8T1WJA5_9STRA|nr:hypothetical protein PHYPSEUDO_011276 [Phytophthora pseudosyringae]